MKVVFSLARKLTSIRIMPNNRRYKSINDQFIVGKSNIENEDFDVFVFAINNIEKVEIPINSELETIKDSAFYNTSIKDLLIPDSVVDLNEGWCEGTYYLNSIKVMPNNKRYKSIEERFIIGKSKIENENFNAFVFAYRDIKEIKIPDSIISIEPFAFNECQILQNVEIADKSNIKIFGKCSFNDTNLKTNKIPSNVEIIGEKAFSDCTHLKSIQFAENPKIKKRWLDHKPSFFRFLFPILSLKKMV